MRLVLLIAGFSLSTLPVAAAESLAAAAASCRPGVQAIGYHRGWPEKSDAICDYGFGEANRRLATLLEAPSGATDAESLTALLGLPHLGLRKGFEPNEFFVVRAGYTTVLAGPNRWDMVIEAYADRREGAWGSKTRFSAKFHQSAPTAELDARANPGCLTEAAVLDRALAAGWRYVPGTTQSGTAGPIFVPGTLAKADGRSFVLANLSRTTALPPRETLEATCAWVFAFEELADVRT